MDPRFTRLYQDELSHLRELGGEFAQEHPKIAARLALDGMEVTDPYVERLLEGFAFMAARVHLKLDAELPQLTAQFLEALYPNFLAPVPSMMIAQMAVDPTNPNLTQGFTLPRGSSLHATQVRGQDTECEFRTTSALTLWPLVLTQVQYFSQAPDLALTRWPAARETQGGVRIRLRLGEGLSVQQLPIDRLRFFIAAPDDVAFRLHEVLHAAPLGTLVGPPSAPGQVPDHARAWRDASSLHALGFGDDEALLPQTLRSFSGHRLIQELAALPQHLLFFEVSDLRSRLRDVGGDEFEIVLLTGRGDPSLEALVDLNSLALNCVPAVNLFPKRLDRVVLGHGGWDFHVVPDRTRPMDYEVHSLTEVVGHGGKQTLRFEPLYHWQHDSRGGQEGWYTVRRQGRRPSDHQRQHGARVPSYLGDEVFVSLVDPGLGAYREPLQQLSVTAWVTNRDLPVLLPQGRAAGDRAWRLDSPGPVQVVRCLRGPTRPVSRRTTSALGWQLLAQLSREHVSLAEGDAAAHGNALQLRELLRLHGAPEDTSWARQADGILSLKATRSVRRLPFAGPLSFGSGVTFTLRVDEQAFHGASAFLLGSVVDAWLARHASINSFTQLSLESDQRGPLMRWPVRAGMGAQA